MYRSKFSDPQQFHLVRSFWHEQNKDHEDGEYRFRAHRVHWHINMELAASYLCFLSAMFRLLSSKNRKASAQAGQSIPGREPETYEIPTPNLNLDHSSKRPSDRFKPSLHCTSHLCDFVSILPDLCRGWSHSLDDTCYSR